MNLKEVIKTIKEQYSGHEDFDQIVSDLGDNEFLQPWADRLCSEDFNQNRALAKELYKLAIEMDDEVFNLSDIAGSLADEHLMNDKEWATTLIQQTLEKEDLNFDDLLNLGLTTAFRIKNKEWAKEIFKKAEHLADNSEEYRYLADVIIDPDYLSDKEWASDVYKVAIDKANEDADQVRLITYSIVKKVENKEWAKKTYQIALDICVDDYERRDVVIDINGVLEDCEWAEELCSEFNISL